MVATPEQKAATGARARAARVEVVKQYKDAPCTDCGGRFPSVCMDFDHVRGTKTANVSRMVLSNVPMEVLLHEISLCELVCANCHRIRTAARLASVKGPPVGPAPARQLLEQCRRGHLLTGLNLRTPQKRQCRACHNARTQAVRARARGEEIDVQAAADERYAWLMARAA